MPTSARTIGCLGSCWHCSIGLFSCWHCGMGVRGAAPPVAQAVFHCRRGATIAPWHCCPDLEISRIQRFQLADPACHCVARPAPAGGQDGLGSIPSQADPAVHLTGQLCDVQRCKRQPAGGLPLLSWPPVASRCSNQGLGRVHRTARALNAAVGHWHEEVQHASLLQPATDCTCGPCCRRRNNCS